MPDQITNNAEQSLDDVSIPHHQLWFPPIGIVVVTLICYVLSVGPAAILVSWFDQFAGGDLGRSILIALYAPIIILIDQFETVADFFIWYDTIWKPYYVP